MIDQKRENLLNLALAATEVERRRVPELSAGYNASGKTWEVIVQYQGDLAFLDGQGSSRDAAAVFVCHSSGSGVPDGLRNGTAADYVSGEAEAFVFRGCVCAEHILYYACAGGGYPGLSGNGVLLACIDSGVDYAHPDFCAPDGTSRIALLWDQTIPGNPPTGVCSWDRYIHGGRSMRHLRLLRRTERFALVPSRDVTGHGTAVLGIAAGNGRSSADAIHAGRGTGSNARCRKAWKS